MKFSKIKRLMGCLLMSFLISPVPNLAIAETVTRSQFEMISTSELMESLNRESDQQEVKKYLLEPEVQAALIKQGLTPEEASARLATLSSAEIKQLSGQIKEARAGGDILVVILLVVLILYFAKRI